MLERLEHQAEISSRERQQHHKPLWPQDLIKIILLCADVEVRKQGPNVHTALVDSTSPGL